MSLKTCYEALGGNYDEAIGRLMSERIAQKFVLKFLNEESYAQLTAALAAKDGEAAFRAAHTLKGVCLNLSFDKLCASVEPLCEALRHGWTDEALTLAQPVEADYLQTVAAVRALQAELGN